MDIPINVKRRKVIYDDTLPGGVALGEYVAGHRPTIVTLAQHVSKKTTNPVIRMAHSIGKVLTRPISVVKSLFTPQAIEAPPVTKLLTSAGPLAIPESKTGEIVSAVKSIAPNISSGFIMETLAKMKTPILVTLGAAAIALAVYGVYRLYKHLSSRGQTVAVDRRSDDIVPTSIDINKTLEDLRLAGLPIEKIISLRTRLAGAPPAEYANIIASAA